MKYLINILRNQLIKYEELNTEVLEQQKLLMKNIEKTFQQQTNKIEKIINDIKILERNKQKWLQENDYSLERISETNEEIAKLSKQIKTSAVLIKKLNDCNQELLKNKMEFITFNVNVLTQTASNVSYQSGGNTPEGSYKKIKMFDQSV